MRVDELFDEIESDRTDLMTGIASGVGLFTTILDDIPAVVELKDLASADPALRIRIIVRMQRLAHASIDPRYANPHDAAMAAYVHILMSAGEVEEPIVETALLATKILQNGFWSHMLAAQFADQQRPTSKVV